MAYSLVDYPLKKECILLHVPGINFRLSLYRLWEMVQNMVS